jgi:hypothetical protein
MIATLTHSRRFQAAFRGSLRRIRPGLSLFTLLILFPAFALAQSPFDTGFTAMQKDEAPRMWWLAGKPPRAGLLAEWRLWHKLMTSADQGQKLSVSSLAFVDDFKRIPVRVKYIGGVVSGIVLHP